MTPHPIAADVLFQYLIGDREGDLSGFRIGADGRVERLSRGAWRPDASLDAARLARARAAVDAAGLRARPAVYRADPPPDDATSWSMQARDATGAVALSGLGCRPAFVDAMFEQIAPVLRGE